MYSFARKLTAIFLVVSSPAVYACDFPSSVTIPNGKTATKNEMSEAGIAIHEYVTEMQAYAACVEAETASARRRASKNDMSENKRREDRAAMLQNKAASAIKDVAKKFDEAVSEYQRRIQK